MVQRTQTGFKLRIHRMNNKHITISVIIIVIFQAFIIRKDEHYPKLEKLEHFMVHVYIFNAYIVYIII